ncbi:MAG: hypothetical protein K1X48_03295 [Burkholderiaceae bacterium]|nr:hypothetical protein [Burkholderiaceae bacterium]
MNIGATVDAGQKSSFKLTKLSITESIDAEKPKTPLRAAGKPIGKFRWNLILRVSTLC